MISIMKRAGVLIVACFVVLVAGAAWGLDAPHDSSNSIGCSSCHTLHGSPGGSLTSVAGNANLCISCHQPGGQAQAKPMNDADRADPYGENPDNTDYRGISHSWGVADVNSKADAGTPTNAEMSSRLESGNIMCSTCHDQHNNNAGTPFLRMSNANNAMCNDCHSARDVTSSTGGSHPVGVPIPGTGPYKSPTTLMLDSGNVECTTCHSPHYADSEGANANAGDGYLLDFSLGAICEDCHDFTAGGSHFNAITGALWPGGQYGTDYARVNAGSDVVPYTAAGGTLNQALPSSYKGKCVNCHWPHGWKASAESNEYSHLLVDREENLCFTCHDSGGPASTDINAEFAKTYDHPIETTPDANHDLASSENALSMTFHVECMDCHNPHRAGSDNPMVSFNPNNPSDPNHATPPAANALIQGTTGIDINGTVTSTITNQYELCFKCHGNPGKGPCGGASSERCSTPTSYQMTRLDGVYNIKDKVDPSVATSYHPIVANDSSNNNEVPSLRTDIPLNKTDSIIYCTDCHNNNASTAGTGTGPEGTHGSAYQGILSNQYTLNPEEDAGGIPDVYALCLKCHDETALLKKPSKGGGPTGWIHDTHVEGGATSCINCHDPHGSHKFNHLLNFMEYAVYGGTTYVITAPTGKPEPKFIDEGPYKGTCYLVCHNKTHNPYCYDQNGKRMRMSCSSY